MSTVVITGTNIPGNMLDISRNLPPDGAVTYRQRAPNYPPATQYPRHRQSYSPGAASHQRNVSQDLPSHKHTRIASSSAVPYTSTTSPNYSYLQSQAPPNSQPDPRRISVGTHHTTTATTNTMSMRRQGTTASSASAPRRSTSSHSSTNSPTSYVALMRKQKATVWCDRSQSLDPRIAAAQRAAKQRATLEVHGGGNNAISAGRTSTINSGGVVGKIRHGGVPKAPGYVPANLSGAGVPMRLSANEMLGDDEEEGRSLGDNSMAHARTGSGRSSTNSTKYRSGYPRAAGSTPPSGAEGGSPQERIPEASENPALNKKEYFDGKGGSNDAAQIDSEDSFGDLKDLAGPSAVKRAEQQAKTAEDLRRRGSVDERAMSLSAGVRLFVANPDLDD